MFSIIYMIRIRFFGPQELIQKHFRAARYPVDFAGSWTPPEYWDAGDIALEMSEHPNIWTDGSREDFSAVGDFEVAGAGVYLLASELASGEWLRSMVMLVWGVAVLLCLFPVSCRHFSVLNSEVRTGLIT